MFMSKNELGCLLLILLSFSAIHHRVLGARNLKENVEDTKKTQNWKDGSINIEDDNGYVATVDREVPTGSDPIHNGDPIHNSEYDRYNATQGLT